MLTNLSSSQTYFDKVKETLEILGEFDSLSKDNILSNLEELYLLEAELPDFFDNFINAVKLCHRAIYYDLGRDQILFEWTYWPKRYDWLVAEFKDLSNELDFERFSELRDKRDYYNDDGEGYPSNIYDIQDRVTARRDLANLRVEVYELCETIEVNSISFWKKNRNYLEFLIISCIVNASLEDEVGKLTKFCRDTFKRSDLLKDDIWEIYDQLIKTLEEGVSSFKYNALKDDLETSPDIKTLIPRVYKYTLKNPPSLKFWEELKEAQIEFQKLSTNYPKFDMPEIKNLFTEGRITIGAIYVDKTFITAALVMTDSEKFLARTKDKLSKLGEVFIANPNVHAWHFLNLAKISSLLEFRTKGIDWSLMLKEVVEDICLASGLEDIIGVVENNNPAVKSHNRIKYLPIPTKKEFESDSKSSSALYRSSFYE